MKSPTELKNNIIDFLRSVPNIEYVNGRQALIFAAGIEKEVKDQIKFEGTTVQFCTRLIDTLLCYGGQNTLETVLKTT